jgi:hypothetical protein
MKKPKKTVPNKYKKIKSEEQEKEQKEQEKEKNSENEEEENEEEDDEEEESEKNKNDDNNDDDIDTISFLNKHKKEISKLFSFSENDFLKMTNFSEFYNNQSDDKYVDVLFRYKYDKKFNAILHDTNNNFIKKYELFYKNFHGNNTKDEKKFSHLKTYPKRHPKEDFIKENPFFLEKILFEIKNEDLTKFYWYLYLIPHKLLQIFSYIFSSELDITRSILIDLKNYLFLVDRCGGTEPFLKYIQQGFLRGKKSNGYKVKKKEDLTKIPKNKKK